MKKSVVVITGMAVVVVIAFVVFFVQSMFTDDITTVGNPDLTEQGSIDGEEECLGQDLFEYPPVDLEKTEYIVPLGLMSGSHVTPVDHMYFQDFDNQEADIEVYSPGPGLIKDIQHMSGTYYDSSIGEDVVWSDYRLVIEHDCELESIFIHIDELSDRIKAEAPEAGEYKSVEIGVDGGEVIGWYRNNVDYNVVDYGHVNPGLLDPELYESEPWKVHTPQDQYSYFSEEVRQDLIKKSLRHEVPLSGKFDWDVPATLQGNWFKEGTQGYQGGPGSYWTSHLSFAPNYLDHTFYMASIGDYDGESEQFGLSREAMPPDDVTPSSGIVEYELYAIDFYTETGEVWDRQNKAVIEEARTYETVQGTILVEMIEESKLKFEVFPGKTAEEVPGFTQDALFYFR